MPAPSSRAWSRADLFASFGKAIIFPAAAAAIIAAHGWFERGSEHASEYAVLIVFAAVGMSVMVSATSLISLYVGLELNSLAGYVLASYRAHGRAIGRSGPQIFRTRARSRAGSCSTAFRCSTASPGTTNFTGIAAAFARGAPSLGLLFGLVFVLAGLAFKASAVPFHMWTPDVYEARRRLLRLSSHPRQRPLQSCSRRVCVEGLGARDRRLAADRDLRRARFDLPRRDRRLRPDQYQATARLFLDQQCRLRPGRPCRRGTRRRVVGAVLHGRLRRHDPWRVPVRAVDARRGRAPGREHREPVGPRADPAGFRRCLCHLHVQPCRHPAVVRLLAQAGGVQRGGRQRLCRARRRRRSSGP